MSRPPDEPFPTKSPRRASGKKINPIIVRGGFPEGSSTPQSYGSPLRRELDDEPGRHSPSPMRRSLAARLEDEVSASSSLPSSSSRRIMPMPDPTSVLSLSGNNFTWHDHEDLDSQDERAGLPRSETPTNNASPLANKRSSSALGFKSSQMSGITRSRSLIMNQGLMETPDRPAVIPDLPKRTATPPASPIVERQRREKEANQFLVEERQRRRDEKYTVDSDTERREREEEKKRAQVREQVQQKLLQEQGTQEPPVPGPAIVHPEPRTPVRPPLPPSAADVARSLSKKGLEVSRWAQGGGGDDQPLAGAAGAASSPAREGMGRMRKSKEDLPRLAEHAAVPRRGGPGTPATPRRSSKPSRPDDDASSRSSDRPPSRESEKPDSATTAQHPNAEAMNTRQTSTNSVASGSTDTTATSGNKVTITYQNSMQDLTAGEEPMRVHWQKDDDCYNCSACGSAFGFFVRKHHCRICGSIFCANCSANTVKLNTYCQPHPHGVPSRVCNPCYKHVASSAGEILPTLTSSAAGSSSSFDGLLDSVQVVLGVKLDKGKQTKRK